MAATVHVAKHTGSQSGLPFPHFGPTTEIVLGWCPARVRAVGPDVREPAPRLTEQASPGPQPIWLRDLHHGVPTPHYLPGERP
jgi:hypothetical protein